MEVRRPSRPTAALAPAPETEAEAGPYAGQQYERTSGSNLGSWVFETGWVLGIYALTLVYSTLTPHSPFHQVGDL